VRWANPWTTSYRGLTVHACSGRSYGGLWTLLALKTLENIMLPQYPHYSADAELLTLMIRIAREVWSEQFIFEDVVENDPAEVQRRLTADHARQIWRRIIEKAPAANPDARGSHSYHIITTDSDGNVASGTTTIEAEPWGDGIFVEGLPLTTAGRVPLSTAPGRRRMSPFAMLLLTHEGRPRFSVGGISNSVGEAAFQLVVNLVDYGLPPGEAVSLPRFGTFPAVMSGDLLLGRSERNWLDPRIERRIVRKLRANGIKVKQGGTVDTGLGAVLAIHPDGTEGVTVPLPYIANPFGSSHA
jgi:gamma-glutamyltranspeptidase